MSGSIVQIMIGFIIGLVTMGIVWKNISTAKNKKDQKNKDIINGVVEDINAICAEIENSISAYNMHTLDKRSLKGLLLTKLETITTKLRKNMNILDVFFVKYVEMFVHVQTTFVSSLGDLPSSDLETDSSNDKLEFTSEVSPVVDSEEVSKEDNSEIKPISADDDFNDKQNNLQTEFKNVTEKENDISEDAEIPLESSNIAEDSSDKNNQDIIVAKDTVETVTSDTDFPKNEGVDSNDSEFITSKDLDKTQIFTENDLKLDSYLENKIDNQSIITEDDSQIGKDFMFGGTDESDNNSVTSSFDDENDFEVKLSQDINHSEASSTEKESDQNVDDAKSDIQKNIVQDSNSEDENLDDTSPETTADSDNLITGEDVMKKMDAFFGF